MRDPGHGSDPLRALRRAAPRCAAQGLSAAVPSERYVAAQVDHRPAREWRVGSGVNNVWAVATLGAILRKTQQGAESGAQFLIKRRYRCVKIC